jgi:hypothetical protein
MAAAKPSSTDLLGIGRNGVPWIRIRPFPADGRPLLLAEMYASTVDTGDTLAR